MSTTITRHERTWGAYLLGFALGGFFDGILLHQVLQWHHLLVGLEGDAFRDIRVQILADGLFHVLMYIIAIAGLWSLWRARRTGGLTSGRLLLGQALLGFGVWHVIDAIVSHWLLGIHRIKMDSPNPLFWDLLWVIVFGVGAILFGYVLARHALQAGHDTGQRTAASLLVITVLAAAPLAAVPPAYAKQVAVVVQPTNATRLLDGLAATGGSIVWADPSASLWVFTFDDAEDAQALYDHGALLLTRSPVALGCLAFTRT